MLKYDDSKRNFRDYPDVLNIAEMCKILDISTKTGYKLLKENKIMYLKVGRAYRIPKKSLYNYLHNGK